MLKNKGGFKLTENSVFVLYTIILCMFGDVSVNLFLFFLAKYKVCTKNFCTVLHFLKIIRPFEISFPNAFNVKRLSAFLDHWQSAFSGEALGYGSK